ncbi:protein kinase [Streptomyces sp. NPDC049585]|uniref:protein kinase domain-containing protein n=1 Tax=Streptomyces sp. NPDC049585 TaxID=3155154 RepID=UPI00341F0191
MRPLLPADPREVGPYRLLARLGSGGMGRVFLGRSRGGRAVAVKLVRAELAENAVFRRRFAQEVAAARRVNGFYTAQVVEADTDADPPWLVTSYIPGPSLQEAVERCGPMPAAAVAALGAGLAEGLGAVHACGVVHRDLKPGNVVLADDGPRVIDFGIARALDATSHLTQSGVIGTAAFMSPEQMLGREATPASDVFCLAGVLVYAASGHSPFGVGPAAAVAYRVVHDEPDLSGVPAGIAPLIRAALGKDPGDRPALSHVLDHCAAQAGGAGVWPADVTTFIAEQVAKTKYLTTQRVPPPPAPPPPPLAAVPAHFGIVAGRDTLFMPALPGRNGNGQGQGQRHGQAVTVVLRYKVPGEPVAHGEPLLRVSTTQGEFLITSPVRGVLHAMDHAVGSSIPVGATFAAFGSRTIRS